MAQFKYWGGLLIPRPHSFLMNSLLFALGAFFAWLEGYRGVGVDGKDMPAWLFVLLWYIAQELLVQQAKYMWNDIRDHERDQRMPANQVRPIAQQALSPLLTSVMLGRWIVGVVLAAWLSPMLLAVVLMFTGLQVLYELRAKGNAARQPLLPLFIVAAAMAIKTGAGSLALGVPPGEQRLWFYGVALFATGVVFVSSFWRVEADFFAEKGLGLPRGQSAYFADKGMAWLKAGRLAAIACCTVLFFDGAAPFLREVDLSTAAAFALISLTGAAVCGLAFWFVGRGTVVRAGAVALFLAAWAAFAILHSDTVLPLARESSSAVLLLILLLLDHRMNVNLEYRQQNFLYWRQNWPAFKQVVAERPSSVGALTYSRQLVSLALVLNSATFDAVRQRQEQERAVRGGPKRADRPAQTQEVHGGGQTS